MRWDDVNARARGLATHLLPRHMLEHLAQSLDLPTLLQRAVAAGLPLEAESLEDPSAAQLDLAVGRLTGARLAVLGRWLGPKRRAALAVVYERLDLENFRRLLRGLVEGASPDARLRGTVPTPDLPLRALRDLADAASLGNFAGRLVRRGHPAGRALVREGPGDEPALLRQELALIRLFATRSARLARRGDPELRRFVAHSVDVCNVWALLLRDAWGDAIEAEGVWLEGGRAIRKRDFVAVARLGENPARRERLAQLLAPESIAALVGDPGVEPSELEGKALGLEIQRLRSLARRRPLGSGPTLLTLLRILAEARDLRAIIWGVALRAPADRVMAGLLAA